MPVLPVGALLLYVGAPRGKRASRDDLVLQPPGQAPLPGSASELGLGTRLRCKTHSNALPGSAKQNIIAAIIQRDQVISSS